MKIHIYLNFEGKTEAAFRFYEQVLGGMLTDLDRFGINWMVNYTDPAKRQQ